MNERCIKNHEERNINFMRNNYNAESKVEKYGIQTYMLLNIVHIAKVKHVMLYHVIVFTP